MAPKKKKTVPLVVDFDGTMHFGDLSLKCFLWVQRRHWWLLPWVYAVWFVFGRGAMKLLLEKIALKHHWHPKLRYDERMLTHMRRARKEGREVLVASGSPQQLLERVLLADGLDYPVLGTTGTTNLVAANKASALVDTFGEKGFDYAGNSRDDLAVWPHARRALVVNAKPRVVMRACELGNVEEVFSVPEGRRVRAWLDKRF